jgi:hypothetical protein
LERKIKGREDELRAQTLLLPKEAVSTSPLFFRKMKDKDDPADASEPEEKSSTPVKPTAMNMLSGVKREKSDDDSSIDSSSEEEPPKKNKKQKTQ